MNRPGAEDVDRAPAASGGLGEFVGDDGVEVEEADHRLLERDDAAAEGPLGFRNDFRRRLEGFALDGHHVGNLLDEQADQIFAITDDIAERARKIGGGTLRSIGQIGRLQRLADNDAEFVTPADMLAELADDNSRFVSLLRAVHELAAGHNDSATTSLVEVWIDEAERRTWFLFETGRAGN